MIALKDDSQLDLAMFSQEWQNNLTVAETYFSLLILTKWIAPDWLSVFQAPERRAEC